MITVVPLAHPYINNYAKKSLKIFLLIPWFCLTWGVGEQCPCNNINIPIAVVPRPIPTLGGGAPKGPSPQLPPKDKEQRRKEERRRDDVSGKHKLTGLERDAESWVS